MKRAAGAAKRGEIGLVRLRSGAWGIRWGRALARRAGLPLVESTQTHDRTQALQFLDRRRIDVYRSLGDVGRADDLLRDVTPAPLSTLISDFLRAYRAGDLPGRKPSSGTLALCAAHLLGRRGGLLGFAASQSRVSSMQFDVVLISRWLEQESRRLSNDTLRMKLVVARRLAQYGRSVGLVRAEALDAISALRPPPSARGRARVDGVPSMTEVTQLLREMIPLTKGSVPWHLIAELQLRLGLRRAEVIALDATWLDEANARVFVRASEYFDTKSHSTRIVDGVDAATFALAYRVVALTAKFTISVTGYRMAWRRACLRLARSGHPWRYRNKSHALRSAYATLSRLRGVPLSVVRDRLGHASERTTERHYLGRSVDIVQGPFAEEPLLTGLPTLALVASRSA